MLWFWLGLLFLLLTPWHKIGMKKPLNFPRWKDEMEVSKPPPPPPKDSGTTRNKLQLKENSVDLPKIIVGKNSRLELVRRPLLLLQSLSVCLSYVVYALKYFSPSLPSTIVFWFLVFLTALI